MFGGVFITLLGSLSTRSSLCSLSGSYSLESSCRVSILGDCNLEYLSYCLNVYSCFRSVSSTQAGIT